MHELRAMPALNILKRFVNCPTELSTLASSFLCGGFIKKILLMIGPVGPQEAMVTSRGYKAGFFHEREIGPDLTG